MVAPVVAAVAPVVMEKALESQNKPGAPNASPNPAAQTPTKNPSAALGKILDSTKPNDKKQDPPSSPSTSSAPTSGVLQQKANEAAPKALETVVNLVAKKGMANK